MPYKTVEPAPIGEMNRHKYDGHHTICQKCREIYRKGVIHNDPELQMMARIAMAMGKRMHEKLKEYKAYRESGENFEDNNSEESLKNTQ